MTATEVFAEFLLANEDAQTAMKVRDSASPWVGSPFEWMMRLPSRSRGKAGEVLVSAWLKRLGHDVSRPLSGDHDRVVNGHKVEIKMSTLWAQGSYTFQQLRNQDYEFAFLLGISPAAAHAWVVPKAEAMTRSAPQHGGARGTDTRWLSFPASAPPHWLSPHGGELSICATVVGAVLHP